MQWADLTARPCQAPSANGSMAWQRLRLRLVQPAAFQAAAGRADSPGEGRIHGLEGSNGATRLRGADAHPRHEGGYTWSNRILEAHESPVPGAPVTGEKRRSVPGAARPTGPFRAPSCLGCVHRARHHMEGGPASTGSTVHGSLDQETGVPFAQGRRFIGSGAGRVNRRNGHFRHSRYFSHQPDNFPTRNYCSTDRSVRPAILRRPTGALHEPVPRRLAALPDP